MNWKSAIVILSAGLCVAGNSYCQVSLTVAQEKDLLAAAEFEFAYRNYWFPETVHAPRQEHLEETADIVSSQDVVGYCSAFSGGCFLLQHDDESEKLFAIGYWIQPERLKSPPRKEVLANMLRQWQVAVGWMRPDDVTPSVVTQVEWRPVPVEPAHIERAETSEPDLAAIKRLIVQTYFSWNPRCGMPRVSVPRFGPASSFVPVHIDRSAGDCRDEVAILTRMQTYAWIRSKVYVEREAVASMAVQIDRNLLFRVSGSEDR